MIALTLQQRPLVCLLSAMLLITGMFYYVDRIWAPPANTHFSDLYPSWHASQELLLHGKDPYTLAVTREVQVWRYGHAVDAQNAPGQQEADRFAYPLYTVFILAPVARLSFPRVAMIFRVLLPALVIVSVPLWLSALRWHCGRPVLAILILFSVGSFPVLESIYLQQPALLAAALLAGAWALFSAGRLGLAGVLLAFSTMKPQLTGGIVFLLMMWALAEWRVRKNFIWGFGLTFFALVGFSEILLPGWIPEFIAGLRVYRSYTGTKSILSLWFGSLSIPISVALGLCATYLIWRVRAAKPGSRRLNFVLCAILVTNVVIIPTVYPTGQIVLLPAIFWLLMDSEEIWKSRLLTRLAYVAVFSLMGWALIGASILSIASLGVGLARIREFWILPIAPLLLIPPVLLFFFATQAPTILRASALDAQNR